MGTDRVFRERRTGGSCFMMAGDVERASNAEGGYRGEENGVSLLR